MANCPTCHHEVSVLLYSFRASTFLRNFFRSPANRITVCRGCGEELTLTTGSFIFCQVAFIVIVIPCAILLARFETWLIRSVDFFHQLSVDAPAWTLVCLWILPTLVFTLFIYSQVARRFVEFEKAS